MSCCVESRRPSFTRPQYRGTNCESALEARITLLLADVPWTHPECRGMPEESGTEFKATSSHNLMSAIFQGLIGNLLNCEKFNTLPRLLRVIACVVRAVRRFQSSRDAPLYFDSRRVGLPRDVVDQDCPMMVKEPGGLDNTTEAAQSLCKRERTLAMWRTTLEFGSPIWDQAHDCSLLEAPLDHVCWEKGP